MADGSNVRSSRADRDSETNLCSIGISQTQGAETELTRAYGFNDACSCADWIRHRDQWCKRWFGLRPLELRINPRRAQVELIGDQNLELESFPAVQNLAKDALRSARLHPADSIHQALIRLMRSLSALAL